MADGARERRESIRQLAELRAGADDMAIKWYRAEHEIDQVVSLAHD